MSGADSFDIATELIGPTGRRILALAFFVGMIFFHGETMRIFNWLVTQRAHELTADFLDAATQTKP